MTKRLMAPLILLALLAMSPSPAAEKAKPEEKPEEPPERVNVNETGSVRI